MNVKQRNNTAYLVLIIGTLLITETYCLIKVYTACMLKDVSYYSLK